MQDRNTAADPESASRGENMALGYRRIIGGRLRSLRIAAGLTQRKLADLIGCGETAISAFEKGRSNISPERYEEFRSIFGLDAVEWGRFLLRYTDPWLYALLFGTTGDEQLQADLADLATASRLNREA